MHDSTTVTVSTGSEPNNASVPEEHNVHKTFNGAPAAVARATPFRFPLQGNLPIDEYFKNKVNPVQRWLKLNKMRTTLAEFTESSNARQEEHHRLRMHLVTAESEWSQVPKEIQELVFDEFPPGGRIAKTPRKSEEEFLQMLVDKYNIGEMEKHPTRPPTFRFPLQGDMTFDEYFKDMKPMQLWLKLNEVKTALADFSEISSASEISSVQDEYYLLSVHMRIALCDWEFVPKNIQKLVMNEFPLGGRVAKTPQKSEEEFLQMLVDKYNIGEL